MLHPSYTELMERINKDVEEGDTPIVQSRYSIVKATADRAKQIIDARSIVDKIAKQIKNDPNAEPVISDSQHLTMKKGSPLIDGNTDDMKPLSIAIEELHKGYVKISERAETDDLPIELQNSEELSDEVAKEEEIATSETKNDKDISEDESANDSDDDEETEDASGDDDETEDDPDDDEEESEDDIKDNDTKDKK